MKKLLLGLILLASIEAQAATRTVAKTVAVPIPFPVTSTKPCLLWINESNVINAHHISTIDVDQDTVRDEEKSSFGNFVYKSFPAVRYVVGREVFKVRNQNPKAEIIRVLSLIEKTCK